MRRQGRRYLDCQEGEKTDDPSPLAVAYHLRTYNENGEKKLWVDSLNFVGITEDE